jgi:1,4-alpha-glucan branching enzyme
MKLSNSAYTSQASLAVIVQLFEWNWPSVQAECATLGQLGYKYVQVSPPAEHITGNQWWTSYQRVSGNLVSKRGNRDQFASMISTCNSAGVQVIVDVVLNHMAASSGTGVGGTSK